MASKKEKDIAWAMKFRREITEARLSRREIMKLGVLGTGTAFLGLQGPWAGAGAIPVSPPTRLWLHEIYPPEVLAPTTRGALEAETSPVGQSTAINPAHHQYFNRFPPVKFYRLPVQERMVNMHSDLPPQLIWGYNGTYPGPTIDTKYGEPVLVRVPNEIPANSAGFGIPQVITHLHNFHSGSESDGGPWNYYDSGAHRDHYYTMARAGFTSPIGSATNPDGWGDPRESLGSLFYHAHRPGFTTQNVYKGQLGFWRIFDELDTGDESTGLGLPSGQYDVPLVFADKAFDQNGQLFFDAFNLDGILGDKPTTNGWIQPYMHVHRRKYRFRAVNGGPSRILRYFLFNETQGRWVRDPFLQIASDGNLLERPVRRGSILHAVAERYDFILNFAEIGNVGDHIIVYNRAEQTDGRGPTGKLLSPGIPMLKFIIESGGEPDSRPITTSTFLRALPVIDTSGARERTFRFDRRNGAWTINGRTWNPLLANSQALIPRGSKEIWNLENRSGGWVHPVHIHFEEHRVLSINGFAPPPWERGRKDVKLLGHGERARVFMQFRDFPEPGFQANTDYHPERGRYVMHCHNTVHEDHEMMMRWDIVSND